MADQAHDQNESKKETEKKQPETVLLTPDELRKVSGGAKVPTQPGSGYSPNAKIKP